MLQRAINRIGQQLVECTESCPGIVSDAAAGILPRGLILERAASNGSGCLVAGTHPCRTKPQERAFYQAKGPSYDSITSYWRQNVKRFAYFNNLRQFLQLVGLDGSIIWSNLAKCEISPDGKGSIPVQTLRVCTRHFLRRELDEIPENWPLFGMGQEAYKGLAYLAPARTVIGIPHPTYSRGQFRELFFNGRPADGNLRKHVKEAIADTLASAAPIALWVS